MATIRIPTVLRPLAGGAPVLKSPAQTLSALRADLSARFPPLAARLYAADGALQEYVNVFVDGNEARELAADAPISPDAEVVLLPAVSGG
ncbi:MAG: MoaD/ThiS family protein [Candidatus Limnocylindria bacterium]